MEGAGIDATGLRLGYFLMSAELEALICSGARRGKQQTYALLEERAPDAKRMDRDEALAEFARRYFRTRGPATLKDFSRWSSLTVADSKQSLEMLDSELEHQLVGDRTYWFSPLSPLPKTASKVIDLVQVYDECVMSYSESRDVLAASIPTQETGLVHAILLDGQLIGHWKRVESRTSIEIETYFYRALDRVETKALHKAVNNYSRLLGKPATIV